MTAAEGTAPPEDQASRTPTLEWLLILGVPVVVGNVPLLLGFTHPGYAVFTNARMASALGLQVTFGGLVAYTLYRRGWRLRDVSLPGEWKDLLRGGAVWGVAYLVFVAGALLAWTLFPAHRAALAPPRFSVDVAIPVILLAAVIDPIFEEGLWLAYVTYGPGRNRPVLAGVISVGARTLVHAYQGWAAVYGVAPLGVWYFGYYRRTRRLVPILIAHGFQDLLALCLLHYFGGAH